MLKILYRQIGKYKLAALLTPLFTALEVVMDVLIPWVTARLIDLGINAGDMAAVYRYGGLMVVMALLSLAFGILAGRFSAYASTGFAANLRSAMYRNIQTFSFSNIDKYSTAGLVTRMTTDVQNLQQAFQQILRVTVRAPFRLLLSIVMCLLIDARLSLIFIVAMLILSFSLWQIISRVSRLFQQVFEKYDALNQSVGENVSAIRVVKAFVREKYENEKFARAAEALYRLYVRAESLMALNHPVMNLVLYDCAVVVGCAFHRRRNADDGRTHLAFHLCDVDFASVDDAVDDFCDAHAECGFGEARLRGHWRGGRHCLARKCRGGGGRRQCGVSGRAIRL